MEIFWKSHHAIRKFTNLNMLYTFKTINYNQNFEPNSSLVSKRAIICFFLQNQRANGVNASCLFILYVTGMKHNNSFCYVDFVVLRQNHWHKFHDIKSKMNCDYQKVIL